MNHSALRLSLAALFVVSAASPALALPVKPATQVTAVNWNLTPAQLTAECNSETDSAKSRFTAIVNAKGPRTFNNTVRALEDLSADLNDRTVAHTFAFFEATDSKVRDASSDCSSHQSAVFNELTADPRLYAAIVAAKNSNTAKTIYDHKLIDEWLDNVKRSGAGLPPANLSAPLTAGAKPR